MLAIFMLAFTTLCDGVRKCGLQFSCHGQRFSNLGFVSLSYPNFSLEEEVFWLTFSSCSATFVAERHRLK